MLAVETGTGVVRLLDPETGRDYARLTNPGQDQSNLLFHPDGTRLIAVNGDAEAGVHVWDLREIRARLAEMGLDWDRPPYPAVAASESDKKSLKVIITGAPAAKQAAAVGH